MKTFILEVFLLLAIQPVLAQISHEPSQDFQSMSIEQLRHKIALTVGGEDSSRIVEYVIKSGRMDLITYCYSAPKMAEWTREQVMKLEDSPTRDQIVITMLRSNSPYLPLDPRIAGISGGGVAMWPIEPFRSVIKKWLPNEPLEESIMNTPEARAVLADKLEATIAGLPAPESKPLKTSEQGQPRSQTAPGTQEVSGSAAVAPQSASLQTPSGYRWWWVLVLFGLGVTLLLLRRARRV